mmetsp:Transcript_17934/g.37850  ORF Transcript_17934/g.37850 Transcript_17934/m.37850 type:complete len:204 (-) Transcript_17934:4-615(-)
MTEVFASAREMMRNNDGAFGKLSRGLGEKLSQVISKSSADERPTSPDSILDFYGDESRRLASFDTSGGWKLASPSARDLAAAGFFYVPMPGCEDRVACYACGKVLFNWDPTDVIADAHRAFSPKCPLLTGEPLPARGGDGGGGEKTQPVWMCDGPPPPGVGGLSANLSSFVAAVRKTAETIDVEVRKGGGGGGRKKRADADAG